MPIKDTVKLILALILGALVLYGIQYIGSLQKRAAQGEQRGRTLEATSGILDDAGRSSEQRVKVDIGVSDAKQAFQEAIEEAKRNEPETSDRAGRPVPDSVRNAYRERRLARERLGRDGAGGETSPSKENPSKR